jgi:hypothetical protein
VTGTERPNPPWGGGSGRNGERKQCHHTKPAPNTLQLFPSRHFSADGEAFFNIKQPPHALFRRRPEVAR